MAAIEQQHPQASGFELITNRAMDANVRFYQRHGYRVVGTIHHSDKISLVRMGKRNSASHAVGPEMTSTTHDEAGRP